jgi:hypothetical protein
MPAVSSARERAGRRQAPMLRVLAILGAVLLTWLVLETVLAPDLNGLLLTGAVLLLYGLWLASVLWRHHRGMSL